MYKAILPKRSSQDLTGTRRTLYDGQFLGEGQLEGFHLRVIQAQPLLSRPCLFIKAVKGWKTLLLLRVSNATQVVRISSFQISRGLHISIAFHDVPSIEGETVIWSSNIS